MPKNYLDKVNMKPKANDPCICGSGKKYKHCCQEKPGGHSVVHPPQQKTETAAPKHSVKKEQIPAEYSQLTALFNAGRYAELESRASLLLERYPDFGNAWKMLGAALLMQGKNSLSALQKATELMPEDAEAHHNLGYTFMKLGRAGEAEASFRRVLQIRPDFIGAHINLGMILYELGRLDEAEASYRRVLQIKPDLTEAHYNLGILFKKQGRLNEAEASYRRVLEIKPDFAEVRNNLGFILKELGRMDEAEASYRWALEIKPDYLDAHYNLGNIFTELDRLGEAEASYRRALQIKPDFAEAYNNLGFILNKLGRLDEAETSYRRALEIKPDFAEAHSNLGFILKELGRLNEAEASYRRVLQIKPDFAEAYNNLGFILNKLGRLGEAEISYRRALEIKPDFAEAYSNLGFILKELGRLDEAEASYRRALQIEPDYVGGYYNLGLVFKEMGRLDEALKNFRLALKAKGDWKEALHRLTTPLVLHSGMVLGSHYPAANPVDTRKQAATLKEQVGNPATPAARQELHSPEAGQSEPGFVKKLRIILIYPPPWQIPSPGEPVPGMPFGPPEGWSEILRDGDFQTITYGLLTIAAQAKRAGHEVSVYNLAICPWQDVVALIAETEADVYGISSFTANRRGMGAVAALIRQHHPQAHIMVGGPFVSALPQDTLRYFRDIDTAVIGEGEETFMELLERIGSGRPTAGIPGTAWRNGEEVVTGPMRPRIKDLNTLTSPFDYFTNFIVMTSRGCPSKCTFCGSATTWGMMLRFHSAESCIDIFKKALARLSVPFIAVKDDTFTAHRKRAIAICDAIIENKMNFLWSCDTRVDSMDDELLRKMRLAGCQTISFGVESGSPEILKTIRKEITPEMVLETTRSAQKYGIFVRYYMILGNRGETTETIQQSIDLIKAGRPSRYSFCTLSFFPGTEDWAILREKQGLTPDIFFTNNFRELNSATNRHEEERNVMLNIACGIGAIEGFDYTVEEREAVVDRLPNLHSAHLELANAYLRAGRLDEATSALDRAEELGFPIGSMIYNQRACIAFARNEVDHALTLLERALQYHHHIVIRNLKNLKAWAATPTNDRRRPPVLNDSVHVMDFTVQLSLSSGRPTAM